MFNFLKKKPTIPENEFGITQEDIRHILTGTQTWGTDRKYLGSELLKSYYVQATKNLKTVGDLI